MQGENRLKKWCKIAGMYFTLVFFTFIMMVLCGEIFARVTECDIRLLKPLLYYQRADLRVHQPSDNIDVHYGMKPGLTKAERTNIYINKFGFRDKDRTKEKPEGVFRIICFGGSNTYGACVDDHETYPRVLEDTLNKRYGNRFEVWNMGDCAQVLAQKIALAKVAMKEYAPDLLLFQHFNGGRRGFDYGHDYKKFFRANKALYWENLTFMPWWNNSIAKNIFCHSALYRTVIVFLNRFIGIPHNNPIFDIPQRDRFVGNNPIFMEEDLFFEFYEEYHNQIPILVMLRAERDSEEVFRSRMEEDVIYLFDEKYRVPNMTPRHFDIHPFADGYVWYGDVLMRELEERGYLSEE